MNKGYRMCLTRDRFLQVTSWMARLLRTIRYFFRTRISLKAFRKCLHKISFPCMFLRRSSISVIHCINVYTSMIWRCSFIALNTNKRGIGQKLNFWKLVSGHVTDKNALNQFPRSFICHIPLHFSHRLLVSDFRFDAFEPELRRKLAFCTASCSLEMNKLALKIAVWMYCSS